MIQEASLESAQSGGGGLLEEARREAAAMIETARESSETERGTVLEAARVEVQETRRKVLNLNPKPSNPSHKPYTLHPKP